MSAKNLSTLHFSSCWPYILDNFYKKKARLLYFFLAKVGMGDGDGGCYRKLDVILREKTAIFNFH